MGRNWGGGAGGAPKPAFHSKDISLNREAQHILHLDQGPPVLSHPSSYFKYTCAPLAKITQLRPCVYTTSVIPWLMLVYRTRITSEI